MASLPQRSDPVPETVRMSGFFFSKPVPAAAARRMGSSLLTETMARRHELPFFSYDRLFSTQDIVPKGGFGNLIALPFQGQTQRSGKRFS